jgi:cobalt/nickel transport system permease protein
MAATDSIISRIGDLDTLARRESFIHHLDPRAKLLTTLAFTLTMVSFGKYQISAMLPMTVFPVVLMAVANLPAGFLIRRVLWVTPLAVLVGVFNPLLDTSVHLRVGTLEISGGWISFLSILIRFFLTVLAALILVATTGFNNLCAAMEKIGFPNIFVMQLLFLYRYAFVLAEEGARMVRACRLRAPLWAAINISTFSVLLGSLFLRTAARAQRIYQAMCSRGFQGRLPLARSLNWTVKDTVFILIFFVLLMGIRCFNLAVWAGELIMGFFS